MRNQSLETVSRSVKGVLTNLLYCEYIARDETCKDIITANHTAGTENEELPREFSWKLQSEHSTAYSECDGKNKEAFPIHKFPFFSPM